MHTLKIAFAGGHSLTCTRLNKEEIDDITHWFAYGKEPVMELTLNDVTHTWLIKDKICFMQCVDKEE